MNKIQRFCRRITIFTMTFILLATMTLIFPNDAEAAGKKPSVTGSSTITKGKTAQFSVTYNKKNVPAKSCKWYTSKKSVAGVSKTGKVTAKKNGTAYIYVKYKGKLSAKKKITVSTASLSKSKITLKGGKNYTLKTKYAGKYVTPTYKSNNKKVAIVNKNGKVIALKKGKATISATYKGSTAKCTVTVSSNHTHSWKNHTATKKVWIPNIVTVPDYATQTVTVAAWHCNCGAVITGDSSEHAMNHILNGEDDGGYGAPITETRTVQVGSHTEDHGRNVTTTYVDYQYCSCGTTRKK